MSKTTLGPDMSDPDRERIFSAAAALAGSGRHRAAGGAGGAGQADVESLATLLPAYYRHAGTDELAARTDVDVYGAFASHQHLAQQRLPGMPKVRVFTPTVGEHGWSAAGHSVVEVVCDDMPFLVDSITMELGSRLHDLRMVVHPTFDVRRDAEGRLLSAEPVLAGSTAPAPDAIRESWMHVEIARLPDDGDRDGDREEDRDGDREGDRDGDDAQSPHHVGQACLRVLRDVQAAVSDWPRMTQQVADIVADLDEATLPVDAAEVAQAKKLLEWLADEHFTFIGYREYVLERVPVSGGGHDEVLRPVPGTGLGILRERRTPEAEEVSLTRLPEAVRAKAREKTLLVLAKANSRSTVHRRAYLDNVSVKVFGPDGEVVGERRFLGLLSSAAYTESLLRIPLLREKVAEVLRRSGFDAKSHDGAALLDTLETYPRDELFHTPVDELVPIVQAAMQARERRAVRLLIRRDTYGRYLSVLVYLPRDRYNTGVRQRFVRILLDRIGRGRITADDVEFSVSISQSATARVHFVVHVPRGELIGDDIDTADLERRLVDASRSWTEDFLDAVSAEYGEEVGAVLGRRYGEAFPEAYKEDFTARTAAVDVARLEGISSGGLDQTLYADLDADDGEARFKVFRVGEPLSLSDVLPMLSSLGVEVIDERPYSLTGLERPTYVYDFGLRHDAALPEHARALFSDALRAMWDGLTETDGFNRLVLRAALTWRQAMVLRAYARYMKQGSSPFSLGSIEAALVDNVDLTRLLVHLFEARFDPAAEAGRAEREAALVQRAERALDDVVSLDADRILRSYLALVRATLRTNYFQDDDEPLPGTDPAGLIGRGGTRPAPRRTGRPKPYLSLKLDPTKVPDLPDPRPRFEIFVYSPRVEGVHLRFGAVARGGLRWSDRRDDYRTEILGLVKAQMVKNTVIVPVGAKGGFYAKQLPDPSDREAWLGEGVACYRTFIRGLLDLTDNLVAGEVVPPPDVVRHDDDDTYLVVAADKGTASFSDIANGVAADYRFWLGDAFASGGSVGYDHKAMGITARGAWVSVRRHFRELGVDCQDEDITVVGIGDMSGDVFGNGMLCSEHIRLVAAFDHRDIFLDPQPDAATSYAERRRLFELPRSSWADYDTSLISTGGGVYSRSAKSIPLNQHVRDALGIADDVARMTPADLIRAILLAPVDLLWNGGIGTYVKASTESQADAGDKSNDAIRVDGAQLRVRCVGEGGNLGFTQRGRIEYALNGGLINTDFIDNSAGVDTSDHEVNLKILLDRVVQAGDLTAKQRNELLASMTDEVAELVLRDNYEQNLTLANAARNAPSLLHVHEEWMRHLEGRGLLDRALEALPSRQEVRRRIDAKGVLTQPELAVLMAYTKIVLSEELLASDLPEDPYLTIDLESYFPAPVREGYAEQVRDHPLRRQIIVTQVVNDLVNGAGMTYWPRLSVETGASAADLTRANFVAREIFGSLALRTELEQYDNVMPALLQTRMRVAMRTLVERASRWLISNRRTPLDSASTVAEFAEPVQATMLRLPELLCGSELAAYESRRQWLEDAEVPAELAARVASYAVAHILLDVVEIAGRDALDPAEVARVHFALAERLGISTLQRRITDLPRDDQWQTMARAALREDLHGVHAQLTEKVLAATTDVDLEATSEATDADEGTDTDTGAETDVDAGRRRAQRRVAAWEKQADGVVEQAARSLAEVCEDEPTDIAKVSVGLRVVRTLLT
ncbi:NAD-glutamate dehydrogenase [Nocardioides faecalis]|uniref:NAD-glutamate dehydrogenase n=1 Tax=Nocardioides faecalis TaxID=2803858 RepID=UPI0027DBAE90|nr:NAD-glutamate dehydrogenase [Nocardioides faecalis]